MVVQNGKAESFQRVRRPMRPSEFILKVTAVVALEGACAPRTSVPAAPRRCTLQRAPSAPGIAKIGLVTGPRLRCMPMPKIPWAPVLASNPAMLKF